MRGLRGKCLFGNGFSPLPGHKPKMCYSDSCLLDTAETAQRARARMERCVRMRVSNPQAGKVASAPETWPHTPVPDIKKTARHRANRTNGGVRVEMFGACGTMKKLGTKTEPGLASHRPTWPHTPVPLTESASKSNAKSRMEKCVRTVGKAPSGVHHGAILLAKGVKSGPYDPIEFGRAIMPAAHSLRMKRRAMTTRLHSLFPTPHRKFFRAIVAPGSRAASVRNPFVSRRCRLSRFRAPTTQNGCFYGRLGHASGKGWGTLAASGAAPMREFAASGELDRLDGFWTGWFLNLSTASCNSNKHFSQSWTGWTGYSGNLHMRAHARVRARHCQGSDKRVQPVQSLLDQWANLSIPPPDPRKRGILVVANQWVR